MTFRSPSACSNTSRQRRIPCSAGVGPDASISGTQARLSSASRRWPARRAWTAACDHASSAGPKRAYIKRTRPRSDQARPSPRSSSSSPNDRIAPAATRSASAAQPSGSVKTRMPSADDGRVRTERRVARRRGRLVHRPGDVDEAVEVGGLHERERELRAAARGGGDRARAGAHRRVASRLTAAGMSPRANACSPAVASGRAARAASARDCSVGGPSSVSARCACSRW